MERNIVYFFQTFVRFLLSRKNWIHHYSEKFYWAELWGLLNCRGHTGSQRPSLIETLDLGVLWIWFTKYTTYSHDSPKENVERSQMIFLCPQRQHISSSFFKIFCIRCNDQKVVAAIDPTCIVLMSTWNLVMSFRACPTSFLICSNSFESQ